MFSDRNSQELRFRWIHKKEYWDQDTKVAHSRSYHNFFEGYSEEKVPKANGKGSRIVRTYVGKYYERDCSDRAWLAAKIIYIVLFVVAAALYIVGASMRLEGNSSWYVALPGLLVVLSMIFLGVKLAGCTVAKRTMVAYEFKTVFGKVFIYSMVSSGLFLMTALANVINVLISKPENVFQSLLPTIFNVAACAAVLAIGIIEAKAEYISYENENAPAEGSNDVVIQAEI